MLGFFTSTGWLGIPSVQSHNRAHTKKKDACYPKRRKTLPHSGVQPTATERRGEELAGFHDPSTPLETHVKRIELERRAVAPAVARISATLYPIRTWGYSVCCLNVIVLRRVPLSKYSPDPRTERPADLLEPDQIAG